MIFANSPDFKVAYQSSTVTLYEPLQFTSYHTSRYLAMEAQNRFSAAGITKNGLVDILQDMIKRCNDKSVAQLRTDIAALANGLLYRTKYPVDEECAIRMGTLFYFLEGEDPNSTQDAWMQKKMEVAKVDPDLYTFFLSRGIINTPAYEALLQTLEQSTAYFQNREQTLNGLLPQ